MGKSLVLGGAGFVGSHLVERLLKEGEKVIVIDNLSVGKRKYLPKKHKNLTFIKASILDDNIEKYFKDVDLVFHLAALTRPQESILDPVNTTRVNIEGIVKVLSHSAKHPVKRFIYVSSTSAYGAQKQLPTPETAILDPMSPYAVTKLAGEQYCRLYQIMYGLQYNIIRPFNIYGGRQSVNGGYAAAVPNFIKLLNENKSPWITGDGTQARDFIYVDDVVDLLIKVSKSKVHGEIFNAGYGKNTSINELYTTIAKLMNKNIKASHIAPVFEPKETLGDIRKAKELLGWEPKIDLKEGLKRTVAWYRKSASIYLQYAGGNSLPHEIQDKSRGWAEFFEAQCLVESDSEQSRPMVTMKTSEISPTGVMVVQTGDSNKNLLKNVGDLNLEQATSHLTAVSDVMNSLSEMLPEDKVKLWHINNSAEIPTLSPSDLGVKHPNAPAFTSQKIAVLHSHCDSLSGKNFIQVNTVRELRKQHASHIGVKQYDEAVNAFVNERKRNMKPHVFQRIAKLAWETDLSKELIHRYPKIFEQVTTDTKIQAELPLPPLSIQIKGNWKTLKKKDFAEALLFTHKFVVSKWNDFVFYLENPDQIPSSDRKLKNLAKRQKGEKDWLHDKYNYTVGVVQWNNGNLVFFIDPTVDVPGGVQSTNIHSVREARELSVVEKEEREIFRTTLTKRLLKTNSNLKLGTEGNYLLNKSK